MKFERIPEERKGKDKPPKTITNHCMNTVDAQAQKALEIILGAEQTTASDRELAVESDLITKARQFRMEFEKMARK